MSVLKLRNVQQEKVEVWIVEIEKGVWLAARDGDPGRTLVKENAKRFRSELAANRALGKARSLPHRNGFPEAKIESLAQ